MGFTEYNRIFYIYNLSIMLNLERVDIWSVFFFFFRYLVIGLFF